MDDNSVAVRVDHVSKDFRLPSEKITSVKNLFVNPLQSRKALQMRTQKALQDVSFEVKKGEFFGIVGRNGSGKSTLLKIIAGIYQPTHGSISIEGKLVPFIELGVGFNPELTGRENVYLNGGLMGFSTKEVDAMYDDIVSFAELEGFMDQKLKNYSSGMQVRLAFSVATRSKADVLLIDEVLAVGDAEFQRKCFDYFKSLKKQKKTVIFVSHDMEAVREYCDRAMLIEDSVVVKLGTAQKVALEYKKLFIEELKESQDDKGGVRWGTEQVVFQQTRLEPKKLDDSIETIELHATFKAKESVEAPLLIGFSVKTLEGSYLIATNNRLIGFTIPPITKGEVRDIQFSFPNILEDATYTISLAIESDGGGLVFDWWDEAITFKSRRLRATPAPIHVPVLAEYEGSKYQ